MYCGQTAAWLKMPALGTAVGLGQATLCYMRTQLPLKRGTAFPQFSAHACCGQTAGWIKMPLGMEIDLDPGHIVSDTAQLLPRKGAQQSPIVSAHVYCGKTVAHLSYC